MEVVKGGPGLRLTGFASIVSTTIGGAFEQRLQVAGVFTVADRPGLQPLAIGG